MRPKTCFPIPAALDGARWTIRRGGGGCDNASKTMVVPMDDTPEDRFVRAHELAHAAITPAVTPGRQAARHGVSVSALQVCEDARVNAFLRVKGIDCHAGMTAMDAAQFAHRNRGSVRKIAEALVSCDETGDRALLFPELERVAALPDGIGLGVLATVARYARRVAYLARTGEPRKYGERSHRAACLSRQGFTRGTVPAARLFDLLFGDGTGADGAGGIVHPAESAGDDGVDEAFRDWEPSCRDTPGSWGKLDSVKRVPMDEPRAAHARRGAARSWRDEGACPTAVHRWTIDGRLFARRRPAPGGTVLVDVSGSMSLSAEDLRGIVAVAPAATVAIYSGSGRRGGIRIVAQRGRVASEAALVNAREELGGGNIIDGPALRWLAKQPGPRFWVSDGAVTGEHDGLHRNLTCEAFAMLRPAGIERVGGSAEALAALSSKGR